MNLALTYLLLITFCFYLLLLYFYLLLLTFTYFYLSFTSFLLLLTFYFYLLLLTEVVKGWTVVTLGDAMVGEAGRAEVRLEGGDQGGATISPTSSSHKLDTRRRLFAPLHSSSASLSRSARSDSSELSPSRSSSTEKVKRWRGTDKFCL